MPSLLRRSVAEFLGTFALTFFGAGAAVATILPGAGYGLLGIALAHALVLAVMVTAAIPISGGHFNPAVTLGLLVGRRTDAQTAAVYIVTQLAAAVLAALAIKALFPPAVVRNSTLGTPLLASAVTFGQGVVLEAIFTFFLVSVVFGTCVNAEAPRVGGFAIGLTLFFAILVGGPMTGAALNPARAFGPAIVSGNLVGHLVYWIGPIVGGLLAALLWDRVLLAPAPKEGK
ncbi:MAG TPA: aquaporin [Gemmatimonadales bacterium]|nr:aquaporin [Gemmatimonadales bacterium]